MALAWVLIVSLILLAGLRLLLVFAAFLRRSVDETAGTPAILVAVPAHNEEASLPRLLQALDRLDYPGEQLEFVFVNDASTDATA